MHPILRRRSLPAAYNRCNMNFLAIETATERLSLAILYGTGELTRDIDAGQQHSELALPTLHALLAEAKLTLADMDGFVFGRGPGSFTGVRIACALVQGLALGTSKPLIGLSTLLSLAEQCPHDRVLVAQDARMGEFYLAAYQRDTSLASGWRIVHPPTLAAPATLPELEGTDWYGVGSAFSQHVMSSVLTHRYGKQLVSTRAGIWPRAIDLARVAARQGTRDAPAAEDSLPLYLRNKVAQTLAERTATKIAASVG